MRIRNLVTGLALALLPVAVGAQQGDPGARIDAAMQAAARAEIPVSLIQSKVSEGRAKGIAEARIASAVEARLEALVRAHSALARGRAQAISAGELSIAADALQAGVHESAMVDVMTGAPAARRAVATAVLTELVELGLASEVALARVQAAIAQGGEALVNLPGQASDRARGHGRGGVRGEVGNPAEVDAGVRGGIDVRGRGRPDGAGPDIGLL
jgi:hypothetical protein